MKRIIFLFIFLIGVAQVGVSQTNYPIQAGITLSTPYSLRLSDYTEAGQNRISVTLNATDQSVTNLQVKLRFTIEGPDVLLRTREDFQPTPIILNAGQSEVLTAEDLSPYFLPQNLEGEGLGEDFNRFGLLPEGYYIFNVEVIEIRREVAVSIKSPMPAFLFWNDPPRWQMPAQNEIVLAANPQNLQLNWFPMHTSSPNASNNVEYELTIVEMWPDPTYNAVDLLNSASPFHRETTRNTSYFMDALAPAMYPGRTYAARLRAYDVSGADLFQNNGYSDALVFTFGQECKPPENLTWTKTNNTRGEAEFTGFPNHTDFEIQYQKTTQDQFTWYSQTSLLPYSTISELSPNTTYRYRVQAQCGSLNSEWSEIFTFSVPGIPAPTPETGCNASFQASAVGASSKTTLNVGEYFTIDDYNVEVSEVTASTGGMFVGKGFIALPIFKGARFGVKFDNLSLNNDSKAISGSKVTATRVEITSAPYTREIKDKLLKPIIDASQQAQTQINKAQNLISVAGNTLKQAEGLSKQAQEQIKNGKDLIQKGKNMMEAGNVGLGQIDVNAGLAQIDAGVKTAVNEAKNAGTTVANTLNQGADKLKEIFEKLLKAKQDTARADSADAEKKYRDYKKEYIEAYYAYNGDELENTEDTTVETFSGDPNSISSDHFEVIEASVSQESDSEELALAKKHHKKEWQKTRIYINKQSLKYISDLLINNQNIGNIISSFKLESIDFLKTLALDALSGAKKDELENKVKVFITKKISENIKL